MKVKVISLPYIFQVLYVLCFTRPRYQVSVYKTIGPLVCFVLEEQSDQGLNCLPFCQDHFLCNSLLKVENCIENDPDNTVRPIC